MSNPEGAVFLKFRTADVERQRLIYDSDGDGWCDLWSSLFGRDGQDGSRSLITDADGDGMTDFEEMVLLQNPYFPDELPRHKTPEELAEEKRERENRRQIPATVSGEQLAWLVLEGIRTTIDSAANAEDEVPTAEAREERLKNLAASLRKRADASRALLEKASGKGENRGHPHHVDPSGKVEYVFGASHSADLIGADELWPAFDAQGDPIPNEAGYGDLTGADPDPINTGLGPLPPVGIWEFAGWPAPNLNPLLAPRLIFGNSISQLEAEDLIEDDDHAVQITEIIGLPDPSWVWQGMAYQSKLKIYSSRDDYVEMAEAVTPPEEMYFSNHSYGLRGGWASPTIWVGPLAAADPNAPLGPSNPVYEDPEFGAYTL